MIDSQIYSDAWNTDEMRAIFNDEPRTQGWLDVIAALAEAQAEVGLIPAEVVSEIKRVCNAKLLSMEALRKGYQKTGHSTLGLIRELKRLCNGIAGEWVYYGATLFFAICGRLKLICWRWPKFIATVPCRVVPTANRVCRSLLVLRPQYGCVKFAGTLSG
jgi:hypothetical protein